MHSRAPRQRAGLLLSALTTLALLATLIAAQEPIVIGDSRDVTPGLLGLAREMRDYRRDRATVDFVLLLGDNIYGDVFLAKADATTHSFLIARVTPDAIHIEALGASGRTFDTFEVHQTEGTQ